MKHKLELYGLFYLTFLFTIFFTFSATAKTFEFEGDHSMKTYMDYRTITNKNSLQYALQQEAETTPEGIRIIDGRFIIAIGSGMQLPINSHINVYLDNDNVIPCIVGDIKQSKDTGNDNIVVEENGNIVEFIVDSKNMDPLAKKMGNISYIDGFDGNVVKIEIEGE